MANFSWHLRKKENFQDFAIVFQNGETTRAHKIIVAASSDFFHNMFLYEPSKSQWIIPDFLPQSKDHIDLVLDYIYTSSVQPIREVSTLIGVYMLSDYLLLHNLRAHCVRQLKELADLPTWLRISRGSLTPTVEEIAVQKIASNFVSALQYKEMVLEMSAEVLKSILKSEDLAIVDEMSLFYLVKLWLQHDPTQRPVHLFFDLVTRNWLDALPIGSLCQVASESIEIVRSRLDDRLSNIFVFIAKKLSIWYAKESESNDGRTSSSRKSNTAAAAVLAGGESNGYGKKMYSYFPAYDTWLKLDTQLRGDKCYHGAAVINDTLYIVGGYSGLRRSNSLHSLDLRTMEWTELEPMHQSRCYVTTVALDGYLYAMGGFDGTFHVPPSRCSTVERFDPSTGRWTFLSPMINARSDAGAVSYKGKIWIVGGYNGTTYLQSVERYSPATDTWEEMADLNLARGGLGCAVLNNRLFAIGGFSYFARLDAVEWLDLDDRSRAWESAPKMILKRSNFGVTVLNENQILVAGGFTSGDNATDESELFFQDSENWEWRRAAKMPRKIGGPSLTHVKHVLWEDHRDWQQKNVEVGAKMPRNTITSYFLALWEVLTMLRRKEHLS